MSRAQWVVIGMAVLAVWAHQLVLSGWVVDDAAISFAYARNLATGEGLVVVPGGERVEGFSNPLWVGLLAVFEVVGVRSRLAAKGLALVLSGFAAVWVARIAFRERPDALAVLASVFFAAHAQGAIWNASGLENALFTALLVGGIGAVQARWVGVAGLCFGGLALARPEGLLYGLMAGLWVTAAHRRRSWRFWLALVGPFALYEVFRIAYFAWPLPNTYYAKVGMTGADRLNLSSRGWRQLLGWSRESGVLWLMPVWLVALSRSWRWVLGGLVALGLAVWVPNDVVRVGVMLAVGLGFPLVVGGIRGLCGHLVVVGLAFGIYADGDWMRGYRWMSLVAGPLAVLFGLGVRPWIDGVRAALEDEDPMGTTTWVASVAVVGVLVPMNAMQTRSFAAQPVDYPEMIGRRLAYTDSVADKLGLDKRFVSTLEMDMGAHMLDGHYTLVDLAGLVDVPISRHGMRNQTFFQQYVFEERKPTFAHVHRHWARASRIQDYPAWGRDYIELPPYDDDGRPHGGVHLRRDQVLRPAWDGPRTEPVRSGPLELVGLELRTPVAGSQVTVRIGVRAHGPAERPVALSLLGPENRRAEVPLGYGWIPAKSWGDDVWVGRLVVSTAGLPAGIYRAELELDQATVKVGSVVVDGSGPLPLQGTNCELLEEGAQREVDRGFVLPARGRRLLAECWAQRGGVGDLERARLWDHWSPGFLAAAEVYVGRRYAEGLLAKEAGDGSEAYRAFSDVLRVTPWSAWARRHAEQSR